MAVRQGCVLKKCTLDGCQQMYMDDFTRVNLHCHSLFSSDGELTPEMLVEALAVACVRYAALTDHDSLEGLPRFAEAAHRRGIATLPGVELTTFHAGRSLHLLAYGFDPHDPEIKTTLLSLRQARELDVQSIAGSMRRSGAQVPSAPNAAPNGKLTTSDAVDLIHRAGGKAFFAHPLHFASDFDELDAYVAELKACGLDGIEAFYAPFPPDDQARLYALAKKHALLVSAGTDLHATNGQPPHAHGIDMPTPAWRQLRSALFVQPETPASTPESVTPRAAHLAGALAHRPACVPAALLCGTHPPAHAARDCALCRRDLGHDPARV